MFRANIVSTVPHDAEVEGGLEKAHRVKISTQRSRLQCLLLTLVLMATVVMGIIGGFASSTRGIAVWSNLQNTLVSSNVTVLPSTHNSFGTQNHGSGSLQQDQQDHKRFAYFFYVTSDTYACAAIQFIHRLKDVLQMNSTSIDVVVMHTRPVGKKLLRRMREDHHVRTILVEPLRADAAERTWKESLTKLRAFQDWGYERVVFLDADAVPMVNLDHLFDLPKAPLYAPTAYWLEQPFFASTVLVIEPTETVFKDIMQWARNRGAAAGFDMDILNSYFADSVQHLSGVYTVLNSDFRRAPSSRNSLFNTTTELKEHTRVVHFSCKPDGSYGKPWDWRSHDLSLLGGADFEPLFGELFEDYWRGETALCAK